MKILIGLGNPDSKYLKTRHNIGFSVLDHINHETKAFTTSKGDYLSTSITLQDQEVLLVKPMTYMNLSGTAILQLLEHYPDIALDDYLVIYDDFHLPMGRIRFRPKGSDGGHNGIKDIIYKLDSDEFPRLRIGIGEAETGIIEHVLSEFNSDENEALPAIFDLVEEGIKSWLDQGITRTMSDFNSKVVE